MKKVFGFVITIAFAVVIILALQNTSSFPIFGEVNLVDRISGSYFQNAQAELVGSANIVTSVVLGFRAFDTLGEVTVLFVSSLGVALILDVKGKKRMELAFKPNFMLKTGSYILASLILVVSFYMILHGHLSPGGGFPGGAMIASSVLLLYLADDEFRSKVQGFKILESIAGSFIVIIGLIGLVIGTAYFENFLDAGVIGNLLSAGIIPILYVLIGLKVGSEIASVVDQFLTEEEKS
ncbi:cation:proton antiporter [Tenericutes bacterium MO-XQ]|nr:cation:proton antiporter [Tenericutes bacterium MO-XQ]